MYFQEKKHFKSNRYHNLKHYIKIYIYIYIYKKSIDKERENLEFGIDRRKQS
jgi:hypothetical protein